MAQIQNAASSATEAGDYANAAGVSAQAAASSATAAAQSESNASTYEQQAKSQADAAITTVATLTYATDAEATAGTATDRMISPATLKAVVDAAVKEATAAIEKQAKLDAHPVGSYYFSDDSTSPTDLFGGTWEALPPGYTLIAQGSGSDTFGSFTYTAGEKYGERMHQLTVGEMPLHNHSVYYDINFCAMSTGNTDQYWKQALVNTLTTENGVTADFKGYLGTAGGNNPHNNMPPVRAAYAWRRIS